VSDIVGGEDSLFVLGHKGGGNENTDIYVTELIKNFESSNGTISGFSVFFLVTASISAVLIIGKNLQRSTRSK
jgi:hypothetical protein